MEVKAWNLPPALRSRWVLTGIGVVAAGVLVWLFGPVVGLLSGVVPRALAVVMLVGVWAAANAYISQMRQRTERALAGGVTHADPASAEREEIAELRDRLDRAMTLLRGARGSRGYLYEQPWYIIIGPPGAGKTTALANSGLRFPLADELGDGEVRGVGGTRLCDWSFTDSAVLIDTAGRYTTQDSDAAIDRAGWEGFLDLLRRTRAQQPLNGVIVAIGLDSIAGGGETERSAHARAIRRRIKELNAKLGIRLPVYAVFTKADRIQGFEDFFADLDRGGRGQVWGTTFPFDAAAAAPVSQFRAAFTALIAQLSARLIDRLQAERSLERRGAILAFPTQVASLEAPVAKFVDEAFGGTRLDPAPLLRGVYFASATQDGSAIDRLTNALAGEFGIDQRQMQRAAGRGGRGYFLECLFKQVIFGEAMLVSHNPAAMRRRMLWRAAAWAAAALFLIGGSSALLWSSWTSHIAALRYDAAVRAYDQAYSDLSAEQSIDQVPLAGADLLQVLPLLNRARDIMDAAESDRAGLGLSQASKLRQAAQLSYGRTLQYVLLPRLVSIIEARMRARPNDTDYIYHVAIPYQMLCRGLTMDPGVLHAWFANELRDNFAGASLAEQRAQLLAHADVLFIHSPALFSPLLEQVNNDSDLLAAAQAKIGHMSVSDVAYALIRSQPAPGDLADFVPERAAGRLARNYFVRRSGAGLDVPISGFYTPAGYTKVLLARMPASVDRAIRESAARGEGGQIDPNDLAKRQQVEREVYRDYTTDYIATWDGLLGDLDVIPPRSSGAAIGDFSVLTSATGPIALLLGAVVSNVALVPPPKSTAADAGDQAPPDDHGLSGAAVDQHYEALRTYVASGELTSHLQALSRVQARIEDTLGSSVAGGPPPPPSGSAALELGSIAQDAPEPAHRWLTALASQGQAVQSSTQRAATADAFAGQGGAQSQCQRVTAAFPFRPRSSSDASLEDFSTLFAKDGALDSFFTQYLRPYVTTGSGPWRVHAAGDLSAPIDEAAALSFQNAAMIRDAFFGSGGTEPQVRFALVPIAFDTTTKKVTLSVDGVQRSYEAGATATLDPIEWPGPAGEGSASLVFDPAGDGPALEQTGPWALFRLLRGAQVQSTGNERVLRVTFAQGERRAMFDLSTQSLHNPFRASLLDHFTCPALHP